MPDSRTIARQLERRGSSVRRPDALITPLALNSLISSRPTSSASSGARASSSGFKGWGSTSMTCVTRFCRKTQQHQEGGTEKGVRLVGVQCVHAQMACEPDNRGVLGFCSRTAQPNNQASRLERFLYSGWMDGWHVCGLQSTTRGRCRRSWVKRCSQEVKKPCIQLLSEIVLSSLLATPWHVELGLHSLRAAASLLGCVPSIGRHTVGDTRLPCIAKQRCL
jgi:hypothetical protein